MAPLTPKKILAIGTGLAITFLLVLVVRSMLALDSQSKNTQKIYGEIEQDDKDAGARVTPDTVPNQVPIEKSLVSTTSLLNATTSAE